MTQTPPFDTGLQTERTLLAWRRTCLALALGSAVTIRLLTPELGPPAVVLGVGGVVVAASAYVLASHRYRRAHRSLTESAVLTSGGRSLALVFGLVLLLDAAGLTYVLTRT